MNDDPLYVRFIELATRPLEDQPGIRDEARGELMGRLAYSGPPGPALEAAVKRLEESTPRRWRGEALAAGLTGLFCAGFAAFHMVGLFQEARSVMEMTTYHYSGGIAGVAGAESEAPPEDPAAYEEQVQAHIRSQTGLPPDYRQTWRRIDPNNGIWPARAGLQRISETLDPFGNVIDEAAFTEALALLEEASEAREFHSYALERNRSKLMQMKRPETWAGEAGFSSFADSLTYDFSFHQSHGGLRALFRIQAERLEKARDADGLRNLVGVWERLTAGLVSSATHERDLTLMDDLREAGSEMAIIAKRMGMTAEEAKLDREVTGMQSALVESFPWVRPDRRMGLMAWAKRGPSRALEDPSLFTPGRKAEYALLDRILALASLVLLLPVLCLTCFESVRRGRRINGLASGLAPLFQAKDLLWISGLGVALPLTWYLGITRLTPLGCRDIGLPHLPCPPVIIQAVAALLFVGVMLMQTIYWRITRHASFVALGRRLVLGWLVAAIPGVVIPLTGAVRALSGRQDDYLLGMLVALGIPALWLLWHLGATLFSTKDSALRGVLLARNMVAPLAALLIFLAASLPLSLAAEKGWLARDEISRGEPSLGGMTKLEWRSLEQKKAACREALELP